MKINLAEPGTPGYLEWNLQQMAIINDEYEELRERNPGIQVPYRIVTDRYGVPVSKLRNYRANHVFRYRLGKQWIKVPIEERI